VTDGVPVRFISARHDKTYITTQLLSIESGIGIIELRSGMLQPVHFSALTDSARVLYDAPLQLAAVDAVSLEESVETLVRTTTSEPIIVDGFPMYHRSDELVLRRLRDTATDQECPVIISAQATTDQREEWRFDRWFDVILRVRISEINRESHADHEESIEVELIKNRHGTVGTVFLEYTPQNGLVGDIDAERVSMADLHTSLEKINARHGETLRRLGEGHSEEGAQ